MTRRISIFILLLVFLSNLFADEFFTFDKYKKRDNYDFFQINYNPHEGKRFKEVFDGTKATQQSVYIRMLGKFAEQTNKELFAYYEKHIPKKVMKKALKSSGNMHNPAILPLSKAFENALATTTFFKEITSVLKQNCYQLDKIEREKFSADTKKRHIWQPDMWLHFNKIDECKKLDFQK